METVNGRTLVRCAATKKAYDSDRQSMTEAGPAGPPMRPHRTRPLASLGGGAMFNHEHSYTVAMITALTAALVATLFALGHALEGFQTFW
jgi:hypothetical protein